MMIDDMLEMPLKDVLDQFCLVYSPECDYHFGIARWEDVSLMFDEFDLEDKYCFSGDSLIPLDYGVDEGEEILSADDLRCLVDKLGIPMKEFCPECDSENYHLEYNCLCMICEDCGHKGKAKYMTEVKP